MVYGLYSRVTLSGERETRQTVATASSSTATRVGHRGGLFFFLFFGGGGEGFGRDRAWAEAPLRGAGHIKPGQGDWLRTLGAGREFSALFFWGRGSTGMDGKSIINWLFFFPLDMCKLCELAFCILNFALLHFAF